MTLDQFISDNKLTMIVQPITKRSHNMDFGAGARHFRCTLLGHGEPMKVEFSQGSAHTENPTLSEVLDCLASDSSSVDDASGFEDWAEGLGFDADSRAAEKSYNACRKQSMELLNLLGGTEAYEALLYNTDRL